MKAKSFVLLVLILAALLTLSCRKNAGSDPKDQAPAYTPPEKNVTYEGISFTLQDSGWYWAELTEEAKATFTKEKLVIPGYIPGDIPTPVEIVGTLGFNNLTSLKEVVVSYPIETIGGAAFENCTALEKVELPQTLETIATEAFSGCSALTEINLPKDLFGIGSGAFKGCSSLTEITYAGTTEQWDELAPRRAPSWIDEGKTITVHCTNGDVIESR